MTPADAALGQLGEQAAELRRVLEHEGDLEQGLVVHGGHRGGDRLVGEMADEAAHRHVLAARHELGGDLADEGGGDRADEIRGAPRVKLDGDVGQERRRQLGGDLDGLVGLEQARQPR